MDDWNQHVTSQPVYKDTLMHKALDVLHLTKNDDFQTGLELFAVGQRVDESKLQTLVLASLEGTVRKPSSSASPGHFVQPPTVARASWLADLEVRSALWVS